jgi:hypothetical protein
MIHGIDIKTAITLILALTGLISTVFVLLNTLVKQTSEFLVRLLSALQKVVKAARKLTRDLRRPRSPAKDGHARVIPRVRHSPPVPVNAWMPKQSLPGETRLTIRPRISGDTNRH